MDIKTKEKLVTLYQAIPKKTKAVCLKYRYLYNGVNVNIYFDAFDKKSPSFCIILVADNKYYFTPLNILKEGLNTEYLNDIPIEILRRILADNKLDDFYKHMEDYIFQNKPYTNYYSKDTIFTNTTSFQKGEIDLPFWQGVRKVRMSDENLIKLSHRADIPLNVLREIQRNNLTLVRTAKPERRRDLTLILNEYNVSL
ncbi:hypothetical protein [Lysinibacillus sp. FSL W8-0953]|uniref:hypothetical protein n=1 Tax=Lysinibacillus sp. FSL W8-0953 TaxID=2954640 RepID=UPI0030F67CBE